MSAPGGLGIFVSTRLKHYVTDWIPLGGRVCFLNLRLQERSLCILQLYAANAKAQYQSFLDEVGVALQKGIHAESIVQLADFNAQVGIEDKIWKNVIGRQGDSDIDRSGRCLLQFCATYGLCVMNTFF